MPAPYDYASTLGGATGIAPSVQAAITGQQQIEGNKQALASQALQLQLAQKQAERQQQMQRDFVTLADNPTAAGYAHFMTLYPEAHDALAKAWDALDTAQRQGTLRTVSDVYARLQNGDSSGAVSELQAHMDAAKAGGEDTSNYPALIDAIQKDPKQAAALAGYALAAAVPPAQFSEMFKTLSPDSNATQVEKEYNWRVGQFGKAAADTWLATQDTKLIAGQPGGKIEALGPTGYTSIDSTATPQPKGGDPSTGVTVTPTGPAIEHAAFAAVPGLKVTSGLRSVEHNKAVGGVANSYHLTDQARDFVPPKGMPMAMLQAKLKKALPGFDVINEGTHIHVEPGPGTPHVRGPVTVSTPQEAEGLTPGTHYRTPDGREFIR